MENICIAKGLQIYHVVYPHQYREYSCIWNEILPGSTLSPQERVLLPFAPPHPPYTTHTQTHSINTVCLDQADKSPACPQKPKQRFRLTFPE